MAGPEWVESMGAVKGLLGPACYLMGSVALIKAALRFKEHMESPDRVPLSSPVASVMMAAMVLGLPNFFSALSDELIPQPLQQVAREPSAAPEASQAKAEQKPTAVESTDPSTEWADAGGEKPAAAPKPGLSAESFAKAEQAAARELEAKGLGAAKAAPAQGDGGALAWVCAVLAAAGLGGAWARKAAKRIARERQAQALPQVNLDAGDR